MEAAWPSVSMSAMASILAVCALAWPLVELVSGWGLEAVSPSELEWPLAPVWTSAVGSGSAELVSG